MESHPELEFLTRRYAGWANQIDPGPGRPAIQL